MKSGSLAHRWASWVQEYVDSLKRPPAPTSTSMMSFRVLERSILPKLLHEGFLVPPRRGLEEALAVGILSHNIEGMIDFQQFINMLWQPLNLFIDALARGEHPEWGPRLAKNKKALILEMQLPPDIMELGEWHRLIQTTIQRLIGIEPSRRHIAAVTSSVVPFGLDAASGNAILLLRSSEVMHKLLSATLAQEVARLVLAETCKVPVEPLSDAALAISLKGDIVAILEDHYAPRSAPQGNSGQPAKKLRKDTASKRERLASKTQQVVNLLENRMTFRRARETVLTSAELVTKLTGREETSDNSLSRLLEDILVNRTTLCKHLLLLDGAVDRHSSEKFFSLRELGHFAGVAIASDESPPRQPRFQGLRFQITLIYIGSYFPPDAWETSAEPPIFRRSLLADIMHCAGKKGSDLWAILERQLARVGLSTSDVVSGTGDGGGENEGEEGCHAGFEQQSSGYVRRRCLPHISWRVAAQAIEASSTDDLQYKPLCTYLGEGITWSRLRAIAVLPREAGGLGLFRDGSRELRRVFGQSPSGIIDMRPESDIAFLLWLRGKEHHLHRLATEDIRQRAAKAAASVEAIRCLADIRKRVFRSVLAEILERCVFLSRWNSRHPRLVVSTSWDALLELAQNTILDLEISEKVRERFGWTEESLAALDPPLASWVELAVLDVVGDRDLVEQHLVSALDFHKRVAGRAASHLALVGDNTFRTPWLAARMLAADAREAQDAAKALVRHLVTTKASNRTHFESYLFDTRPLYDNLVEFSSAEQAVLVWKGGRKYEVLFRFLAPRFLLAPDHVLDCERVHARWQWSCSEKRGLKLHTLNACLRLTHYIEHNYFPSDDDLFERLEEEHHQHKIDIDAVAADDVALGWRSLKSGDASTYFPQPHKHMITISKVCLGKTSSPNCSSPEQTDRLDLARPEAKHRACIIM